MSHQLTPLPASGPSEDTSPKVTYSKAAIEDVPTQSWKAKYTLQTSRQLFQSQEPQDRTSPDDFLPMTFNYLKLEEIRNSCPFQKLGKKNRVSL